VNSLGWTHRHSIREGFLKVSEPRLRLRAARRCISRAALHLREASLFPALPRRSDNSGAYVCV
jgi:hypothetical protein